MNTKSMELYSLHNYYADKYFEHLECMAKLMQTPSIVDFGTAMMNKRKIKKKIKRK